MRRAEAASAKALTLILTNTALPSLTLTPALTLARTNGTLSGIKGSATASRFTLSPNTHTQ